MMPQQKPGRSRQDYQTPADLLVAVLQYLEIDSFDIDLAASKANAVAPTYYTAGLNALERSWRVGHGWGWVNPPFARIEPWVRRAYEQMRDHGAKTAVLVPAGVGSNWWRDWVHDKAAVLLLNGRITFQGAKDPCPKDCCLLLYAPAFIPGYRVWRWDR